MREIQVSEIRDKVKELAIKSNITLQEDVTQRIEEVYQKESDPLAKEVLEKIRENNRLATQEEMPICQDTGVAMVFLEIGQEVHIVGGSLEEAIQEGVRRGYKEGYLRASMVKHPLDRVNTKDNTPAIIYTKIVTGSQFKIRFAPKGAGSENMSGLVMLKPADGREGVINFILETVKQRGGNACPPLVLGVGIGGTSEKAMLMAKEALLRPLNDQAEHPIDRDLEEELLEKVNALGIGPIGLGGDSSCLAVKVNSHASHIASLPVALILQCHVARHREGDL